MALPLWNSKTAHATQLCLHPNDGVPLGICGSGHSSNINIGRCKDYKEFVGNLWTLDKIPKKLRTWFDGCQNFLGICGSFRDLAKFPATRETPKISWEIYGRLTSSRKFSVLFDGCQEFPSISGSFRDPAKFVHWSLQNSWEFWGNLWTLDEDLWDFCVLFDGCQSSTSLSPCFGLCLSLSLYFSLFGPFIFSVPLS